jgi:hypothetical protein
MADEVQKDAKILQIDGLEDYTLGIPIYVATEDGALPKTVTEHPMFYVLTGNGPMLVKNGPVFSSISKVDDFVGLGEIPESLTYWFEPIPETIVKQVVAFFDWAAPSEAMVLPYYNLDTKEWIVLVPEQTVSAGSIDYEMKDEVPEGFVRLGSWHSHGAGSAYHSSIDTHDEEKDDGIHITFGGFTSYQKKGKVSSSVSLMSDGTRWMMDTGKAFLLTDGLVEIVTTAASVKGQGSFKSYEAPTKKESIAYTEKDLKEFTFPKEWEEKVKKVTVKVTTASYGGYWDRDDVVGAGVTRIGGKDKPNSLLLCEDCDGCKACGSSISVWSLLNTYLGKSNLVKSQHDYTTPEGRAEAIKEVVLGFIDDTTYKEFPDWITAEDTKVIAASVEALADTITLKGLSVSDYPKYDKGHASHFCADPRSVLFGRCLHGINFCLHHRPKSFSKGWSKRTQSGYTDWSTLDKYQEYAETNGGTHYSQLRLDYKTCADCTFYDWNKGCLNERGTFFDLHDSPTGCKDVHEEIGVYPTCLVFKDTDDWDEYEPDQETCNFCKFYDVDLHGIEGSCLLTGEASDKDTTCSSFQLDPMFYSSGRLEETALAIRDEDDGYCLGEDDIVSKDDLCYTCEQRVINCGKSTCLVYNDRLLMEQTNCGFYIRASLTGDDKESEV